MNFFIQILMSLCLFSLCAHAQIPADNPYKTGREVKDHWTNNIKWANAVDVTTVKDVVGNNNRVDSAKIHQLIKKISSKGGGVLYFPEGTYYFNYSLRLESGVVIRGTDPEKIQKAKSAGYKPPTRLEFPRYVPSFTGSGTPHSNFKCIYGDTTGISNSGLVNLDINRATINFFAGGYYPVSTLQGETYWCRFYHNNILIFGIRQNNATMASPGIPTAAQLKKNKAWQRWPYPFVANINVFVSGNCIIANCRLNDSITDNFEQPGYADDHYGDFTGKQATFSYIDHPAICVNAFKVTTRGNSGFASGPHGPFGVFPFTNQSERFKAISLQSEPSISPKGKIEVRDNYLYVKARHPHIMTAVMENMVNENNVLDVDTSEDYIEWMGDRSQYRSEPVFVTKLFEKGLFVQDNTDTLQYRYMRPMNNDPSKKYPLVLFLHPEDFNGSDNNKQLGFFVPILCTKENLKKYPCFILAPQNSLNPDTAGWINLIDEKTFERDLQMAKLLLDSFVTWHNVDRDRIYVVGLSRGGTGAYKLAAHYPELFAASASLDGMEWPLELNEIEALKSNIGVCTYIPKRYGFISLFQISRMNIVKLRQHGNKNVMMEMSKGADRVEMVDFLGRDDVFLSWLFKNQKIRNQYN